MVGWPDSRVAALGNGGHLDTVNQSGARRCRALHFPKTVRRSFPPDGGIVIDVERLRKPRFSGTSVSECPEKSERSEQDLPRR